MWVMWNSICSILIGQGELTHLWQEAKSTLIYATPSYSTRPAQLPSRYRRSVVRLEHHQKTITHRDAHAPAHNKKIYDEQGKVRSFTAISYGHLCLTHINRLGLQRFRYEEALFANKTSVLAWRPSDCVQPQHVPRCLLSTRLWLCGGKKKPF